MLRSNKDGLENEKLIEPDKQNGFVKKSGRIIFLILAVCTIISLIPEMTDYVYAERGGLHAVNAISASAYSAVPVLSISIFFKDLGLGITAAYKIFIAWCCVLTTIGTYIALKVCTGERISALFGTIVYIFCPFRLYQLYYNADANVIVMMAFLPLIIAGVYHAIFVRKWMIAAICMTIIGLCGAGFCLTEISKYSDEHMMQSVASSGISIKSVLGLITNYNDICLEGSYASGILFGAAGAGVIFAWVIYEILCESYFTSAKKMWILLGLVFLLTFMGTKYFPWERINSANVGNNKALVFAAPMVILFVSSILFSMLSAFFVKMVIEDANLKTERKAIIVSILTVVAIIAGMYMLGDFAIYRSAIWI
jgi:hypothetical protein